MSRLHLEVHAVTLVIVSPVRALFRSPILVDAPRVVVIVPRVSSVGLWRVIRSWDAPFGSKFVVFTHLLLLWSLTIDGSGLSVDVHSVWVILVGRLTLESATTSSVGLSVGTGHWIILFVVIIVSVLVVSMRRVVIPVIITCVVTTSVVVMAISMVLRVDVAPVLVWIIVLARVASISIGV